MNNLEEYIRSNFKYSDGKIIRSDRKGGLGSYDKDGYLIIKVKGKQIKAHRLVWFLCKGSFPKQELDHINRIRDDNRIENLRLADRKLQHQNTYIKPNKDTGVVGIYEDKHTKGLKAKYTFHKNGKSYRFRKLEDAIRAKEELECAA